MRLLSFGKSTVKDCGQKCSDVETSNKIDKSRSDYRIGLCLMQKLRLWRRISNPKDWKSCKTAAACSFRRNRACQRNLAISFQCTPRMPVSGFGPAISKMAEQAR